MKGVNAASVAVRLFLQTCLCFFICCTLALAFSLTVIYRREICCAGMQFFSYTLVFICSSERPCYTPALQYKAVKVQLLREEVIHFSSLVFKSLLLFHTLKNSETLVATQTSETQLRSAASLPGENVFTKLLFLFFCPLSLSAICQTVHCSVSVCVHTVSNNIPKSLVSGKHEDDQQMCWRSRFWTFHLQHLYTSSFHEHKFSLALFYAEIRL